MGGHFLQPAVRAREHPQKIGRFHPKKRVAEGRGRAVGYAVHVGNKNGVLLPERQAEILLVDGVDLLGRASRFPGRFIQTGAVHDLKVIGFIDIPGKLRMIAAVEFVKDKKTKEPWKEFLDCVLQECMKRGALAWKAGYYFNTLRMLPPLVITQDLLGKALAILDEAIKVSQKKLS